MVPGIKHVSSLIGELEGCQTLITDMIMTVQHNYCNLNHTLKPVILARLVLYGLKLLLCNGYHHYNSRLVL